jgi:peptide/nickel transport system substrate-binding protein
VQPFAPNQPGYVEDGNSAYPYDLERAKELLAEAGYPDGFDLVMPSLAGLDNYDPVIQSALGDIGIRVTWETKPDWPTYFSAIQGQQYAAFSLGNAFESAFSFYLEPMPGGVVNPFPFDDAHFAELLDLRRYGTAEESAAAATELGQFVLDNAWFLVVSNPYSLYASIAGLQFEERNISGFPPYLHTFAPAA